MRTPNRLAELVALEQEHQQYLLPTHAAQAAARHRALEAVARAARYTLEIIQGTACGCGEPTGSGKGLGLDECPMDSEPELERALARLDRASRASGRGE